MRRTLLAALVSVPALLSFAAWPRTQDDAEQEKREEALSALLTGARLVGFTTFDGRPDAPPAQDSYDIARAEKADGDKWLIESVIGESGLKVPLYLEVKWAGDTPVLTLDKVAVPGMGTFDARVLFHGNGYAGVWSGEGAGHSGAIAGRIERTPAKAQAK